MEKIAVITDSASDVPKELSVKYNINILPFRILYQDRDYRDGVDITAEQVYENLRNETPKTSLPSIEDIENLFIKLENEGYNKAIVITLSSGLSGIYDAVTLVAKEHTRIDTFIWDSKTISIDEGIMAIECGKLVESGKSFEEIKEFLPTLFKRTHLFFVLETLEYLIKGGRIGRVAGSIAELLDIKPIISPDKKDGKYYTYGKARGRKKSLNKLFEIAKEISVRKKCRIFLMHGDSLKEALELENKLKSLPNVLSVYFGGNVSPVAGVHTGPGLLGFCLLEE